MDTRSQRTKRLVKALLLQVIALFLTLPVYGQIRNLPVYHAPDFGQRLTFTMDYGHSGEADGQTIIWGVNYALDKPYPKWLAGFGVGLWDQRASDKHSKLSVGGQVSYRIWPPPPAPLQIKIQAGFGVNLTEGDAVKTIPIGLSAGLLPFSDLAIVKLEVWATPRVHYQETGGASDLHGCSSFGINIGKAAQGGFRLAADLCGDDVGFGYGFNFWF